MLERRSRSIPVSRSRTRPGAPLNSRGNSTGLDDYTAAVAAARTATSLDPQLARGH